MAKITKHGGVSDALAPQDDPAPAEPDETASEETPVPGDAPEPAEEPSGDESDRSDDELAPDAGGNPAPAGPAPDEETAEDEDGQGLDLPPANALKSVWEDCLLGAGVAHDWVYAEGRTKDHLIETGRGLADGTLRVIAGQPVPSSE